MEDCDSSSGNNEFHQISTENMLQIKCDDFDDDVNTNEQEKTRAEG